MRGGNDLTGINEASGRIGNDQMSAGEVSDWMGKVRC